MIDHWYFLQRRVTCLDQNEADFSVWLFTGVPFSYCLPVIISAIIPLKNTEYAWIKSLHTGYEVERSMKIQIFSDLHIPVTNASK